MGFSIILKKLTEKLVQFRINWLKESSPSLKALLNVNQYVELKEELRHAAMNEKLTI